MANASDAYGMFIIKSNDLEVSKKVYVAMKRGLANKEAMYRTDFEKDSREEEGTNITSSFTGVGRWAYNRNIVYMYDWIETQSEKDSELKKIWDELKGKDWSVKFEYFDAEPGNQFVYHAIDEVEHKAGGIASVHSVVHDEYEWNKENLDKYDFGYLWDEEWDEE